VWWGWVLGSWRLCYSLMVMLFFFYVGLSWFWLPFSFSLHDIKSPFILEKKLHFFSWKLWQCTRSNRNEYDCAKNRPKNSQI
jgi:hypothetical protein